MSPYKKFLSYIYIYKLITYFLFCFQWVYVLISINQLLTVLNSTFNFLIYWSFCGRRTRRRANRNQRFAMSTWSSAMTRSHGKYFITFYRPLFQSGSIFFSIFRGKECQVSERAEGQMAPRLDGRITRLLMIALVPFSELNLPWSQLFWINIAFSALPRHVTNVSICHTYNQCRGKACHHF